MIGYLKGLVEVVDAPYVFLDVNGVGYKVLVPASVLSTLQKSSGKVTLFTYTHVREDTLSLFGFLTLEDLKLFETLLTVSGIGPKTALGVFSLGKSSEIIEAIVRGDVSYFTGVPRLGKKNAQKIIIELKNKLGGMELDLSGKDGEEHEEVLSVLKTFGFSTKEAYEALKAIKGEGKTLEEKVRLALKYLGK